MFVQARRAPEVAPSAPRPQGPAAPAAAVEGHAAEAATSETPILDRVASAPPPSSGPPALPVDPSRRTNSMSWGGGENDFDHAGATEANPNTVERQYGAQRVGVLGTQREGHSLEEVDVHAMSREIATVLTNQARQLDEQLTHTWDPDEAERMRREVARLRSHALELTAAEQGPAGEALIARMAAEHRIHPTPRYVTSGTETANTRGRVTGGVGFEDTSHVSVATPSSTPTARGVDTTSIDRRTTTRLGADGAHREQHTDVQIADGDGSGQRTQLTTRRGAGQTAAGWGVGGSTDATHTRTDVDGSATEDRRTSSGGLGYRNGGIDLASSSGRTVTQRDADGEATSRRGSSATGSGGVVFGGEDGTGVRAGLSGRREDLTRDGGTTANGSVDAQLTDRGARANASGTGRVSSGPVSAEGSVGAGGGFRIAVEPIPGTDTCEVVLTLTINGNVGGTAGLGNSERLGNDSRGSATFGVNVTGSRGLVYRHRMTRAEADTYVAGARGAASGGSASGPPEFDAMARLRAAEANGHGLRETEVLSDPAAARAMSDGSSLELTTRVGVSVQGGLSANGGAASAGVTGSAGTEQTRTIRVGRSGSGPASRVTVVVSFQDQDSRSLGAHGALDGVGATATQSSTTSRGASSTFTLDPAAPDYDATFRRITSLDGPQAATALARELGAEYTETSGTNATRRGGVGTMDGPDVQEGLTQLTEHTEDHRVTVGALGADGRRTLEAEDTGGTTEALALNARGRAVLQDSSRTQATSRIGEDGRQTVDVTHTETQSMPVVPAFLADLLHTTRTEISQYRMVDHDLDVLGDRARDRYRWLNCLPGGLIAHVRDPWLTLAASLSHPQPEAAWVAANPEVANKIARGRAITHFMATVGAADGMEATGHALRDWGEGSERLGVHLEFPEPIAASSPIYDRLHARIAGAHALYESWQGPDRVARILRDVGELQSGLRQVANAVTACDAFRNSGAKIETLSAVQLDLDAADALRAEYEATLHTRENVAMMQGLFGGDDPAAAAQPASPAQARPSSLDVLTGRADAQSANVPAGPSGEERARWMHRAGQIVRLLENAKHEEQRHCAEAQRHTAAYDRMFGSSGDIRSALDELDAIDTLFPVWTQLFDELDTLYTRANADRSTFPWQYRPNVNWREQLLHEADRRRSNSGYADRATRWRQQAGRWAM